MRKLSFIKGGGWLFLLFIIGISLFFILKGEGGFLRADFFKKDRFEIKHLVKYFPFSKENSLREWEEKILKGRVIYGIEKTKTHSFVRASSQKAASALYYRITLDIDKRPLISWKWRVDKFPKRNLPERIEDIKEEDFAARVYVIFPAVFFTKSKVIEYIWSSTLPKGTFGTSGYSKNIKVLVLEKGETADWCFEKRDIYKDYIRLFGETPKLNIGAIAFMTDADSTKTSADAVYDEIKIGYE